MTWLRDRLLKLGVHVIRTVQRVLLHLPRSTPHHEAWWHSALALTARAGWLTRRAVPNAFRDDIDRPTGGAVAA